jgi:hypothetical protein
LTIKQAIAAADRTIDQFWSGVWWWYLLRVIAIARVRLAKHRHGDESFQARRATEWWRSMQLAVSYWRPVKPPIRKALKQARLNGVAHLDLCVMNLNLDLVRKAGKLEVRSKLWMALLAFVTASVAMAAQLLSTLQTLVMPVPVWVKISIIVIMSVFYMLLWRGWALYTTRAWATVRRCAPQIRALRLACDAGDVVGLPDRRATGI